MKTIGKLSAMLFLAISLLAACWMRAGIWASTYQLLLEQGLLADPVDPDKVYTMAFLQRIYGGKK
jgi:hypothetical protein